MLVMSNIAQLIGKHFCFADFKIGGVAMMVCKKIVELRGGKIWVESELEKGSTFYFTLPKKIAL